MKDKKSNTVIKEIFNTVSEGYDNNVLRFFPISAEHFTSLLDLRGNEHVLDVAAGTGHASLALSKHLPQGRVTAIDLSRGMLKIARKKASSMNVKNIDFMEMDMQILNFPEGQFDAAVCAFGIFFVEDMKTQLENISQMVKNRGKVAICSFHENYFQPLRDLMVNRLNNYNNAQQPLQTWKQIANESGCKDLFKKAGIKDVHVEKKNVGYFLKNEYEWWDVIWNAGFRRMISQLKPDDLVQFRNEHLREVAALSTKDGIWLDVEVLYTIGRK
jgi:ubiquinone/menaquinone biosynthesis C-methylase UbiE